MIATGCTILLPCADGRGGVRARLCVHIGPSETYVYIYIYTHKYIYIYICTHICSVYVYIYIYTYVFVLVSAHARGLSTPACQRKAASSCYIILYHVIVDCSILCHIVYIYIYIYIHREREIDR